MSKLEVVTNEKIDQLIKDVKPNNVTSIDEFDEIDTVKVPPRIDAKAFEVDSKGEGAIPSFITDLVQLACLDTEASPEGVALNIIAYFSALIGREKINYMTGNGPVDARPSILVVGKSGSNKGISGYLVKRVFEDAQESIKHKTNFMPLNIREGGLNSGEGLIHSLRDASGDDEGIEDKRLLIIEPEFSKVLAVCNRDGATLSGTLRNFHDGRDQTNVTRSNPSKCTRPHLVMLCHITKEELLKKLKDTDKENGFINRFMICHTVQDRDVPNPKPVDEGNLKVMVGQLLSIIEWVEQGQTMIESGCFRKKMNAVYSKLRHPKGARAPLLTRTTIYARMLSMIFAVMEKKTTITETHLDMALVYLRYWWKSAS